MRQAVTDPEWKPDRTLKRGGGVANMQLSYATELRQASMMRNPESRYALRRVTAPVQKHSKNKTKDVTKEKKL